MNQLADVLAQSEAGWMREAFNGSVSSRSTKRATCGAVPQFGFLVLLKTFQRFSSFLPIADVPSVMLRKEHEEGEGLSLLIQLAQ